MNEALILGALILIVLWFGLTLVRDDEVGIVTRKMFGPTLPQGQIIATKGEIGVQADILMPGLYFRIPLFWKIQRAPVTKIKPSFIGVVESIEGRPIPTGRLLADEIDCNSFQDARKFLEHGGCKGPQVATLRPGSYRINTKVFRIRELPVTVVSKEKVGVAIALDGIPLPSGYSVAPEPTGDHKHFQDGQAFIANRGYRGPQLEMLQPGEYYINPLLFEMNMADVATVPPGYVAVIISSVGRDLEKPQPNAPAITDDPNFEQPLHEIIETPLITIQSAALDKVKKEFTSYHVEVQGFLIAYIKVDEKLLETQTRKEIAVQQQQQYSEEAKAQEQRIAVAEKTARADKQMDVITAKLSIDIATDKAQALRKETEGIRDSTKTRADGLAYEAQKVGEGTAAAYKAQTDVLGPERIVAIKLIQEIANGKVTITPNVLVSGDNNQGGNLVNAILATWLTAGVPGREPENLSPE
ncbi:MAG: hypothetical protein METHP_01654 [Methanoregula sp. SKADARSKE-2]|nr:MAG: hypothetical protein METHP_01654 [Methanoregula sp. SKADARSKE-2]